VAAAAAALAAAAAVVAAVTAAAAAADTKGRHESADNDFAGGPAALNGEFADYTGADVHQACAGD